MVDIFHSKKLSNEVVVSHVDLVWVDTSFGPTTPRYFDYFESQPTNTARLEALRNKRRLKHVMKGKHIWLILTSAYKTEISGKVIEFEQSGEHDGVLLWDFIRRTINPNMIVGALDYKAEIEKVTLTGHENNVVKFNTWFDDAKTKSITEEGDGTMSTFANFLECI